MAYKLVSIVGDQSFELRGRDPLVVGRALGCDIPIFDPTVSRQHAELRCDDGGLTLRDLGSANGTWLNGKRVESARAVPGDTVAFGHLRFRVERLAPEPAAPAPDLDSGVRPRTPTVVRTVPVDDS